MADADARRTFLEYRKDAYHAIGLEDGDDTGELSISNIVNDALEHIVALHPWNWLITGEQSLDLVGDQEYVELPADFGILQTLEIANSSHRVMTPTNWRDLIYKRQNPIADWSRGYWYVIQIGNVALGDEDAGLDLPTIALYPTPSEDESDALSIVYFRYIRRLLDDEDRPQWPAYMDRPLSLLSRAFTTADFDGNINNAEMQQFQALVPDLKIQDGLARRSFGVPRGGLYPRSQGLSPFYPTSIPDPVQA